MRKNDEDKRDRKEKKRHRLVGNRGRKKHHYIYNEKKSEIRRVSILRRNRFITNILEGEVMEREGDPDNRTSVTFN